MPSNTIIAFSVVIVLAFGDLTMRKAKSKGAPGGVDISAGMMLGAAGVGILYTIGRILF